MCNYFKAVLVKCLGEKLANSEMGKASKSTQHCFKLMFDYERVTPPFSFQDISGEEIHLQGQEQCYVTISNAETSVICHN